MGLDSVEIMMELEDEFRVQIPDSSSERVRTVGDAAQMVSALLEAEGKPWPKHGAGVDHRAVGRRVRVLISRQLGIPWRRVRPASDFVRDLGMD